MELMEQNDVVVGMVESSVSDNFGKGFVVGGLTTIGIGLAVKLVKKFVVKPIAAKIKQKKEDAEWEESIKTMEEARKHKED